MAKTEVSKSPFESLENATTKKDSVTSLLQNLQQELDKIKGKVENESHTVNFAQTNEFVGTLSTTVSDTNNIPEKLKPDT